MHPNLCDGECIQGDIFIFLDNYIMSYNYILDIHIDINECLNISTHNCTEFNREMCLNTDGSYTCVCMIGFERSDATQTCEGELPTTIYGLNFSSHKYLQTLMSAMQKEAPQKFHSTFVRYMKLASTHKAHSFVSVSMGISESLMEKVVRVCKMIIKFY